jgi:heparanase 1
MHRGLACLLLAGAVGASHVTVGGVISHTDDQYICVNLDWWPHNKCDYGTCAWKYDSMLNINLSHPLLLAAVKGLSPKPVLRLGGSLCDMVTYNITLPDNARATAAAPPLSCQPFELDNSLRVGFKGGCLSMERWLSLHAFAEAAGADVIFGINALRGRHLASPCPAGTDCRNASVETAPSCCTNWTGSWDSSNAEALLAFTAKSGLRLAGVEFGNELVGEQGIESHLAPEVYSADFQRFAEVVEKYFPSALRIAPDNGFDAAWFSSFLALAKPGTVDVVTTHEYTLGAGVDPNVVQRMMDPATLDKLKPEAAAAQKVVESMPSSPKAQLWVGEAGGAYNSGRHLATDAFMSGFWYLDNMAVHAVRGHGRYVCLSLSVFA